jgi:transposase-like protein
MKYAAHVIVRNAIRNGKFTQANNCSVCDSTEKIEGHHDDYTKPLEVRWLCEKCHKEWHRHNKPIYE